MRIAELVQAGMFDAVPLFGNATKLVTYDGRDYGVWHSDGQKFVPWAEHLEAEKRRAKEETKAAKAIEKAEKEGVA